MLAAVAGAELAPTGGRQQQQLASSAPCGTCALSRACRCWRHCCRLARQHLGSSCPGCFLSRARIPFPVPHCLHSSAPPCSGPPPQGRFSSASPLTSWRPPSLQEQLSSFEAASLPNAGKQFTSSGAVRAPSQASTGSDANGRSGGSSGAGGGAGPEAIRGAVPALGSNDDSNAVGRGLGWAATGGGGLPPPLPAEVAQAGFGSQGPPPAPPSLQRPSSPRPPQFRFAYGDPEQEAQRAEQQEASLRQWQAQQGAAWAQPVASHLTAPPCPGAQQHAQPPGWAHQHSQPSWQHQQRQEERQMSRWDHNAAGLQGQQQHKQPDEHPEGRQRWRGGSRSRSRSRERHHESSSRQRHNRSRSRERRQSSRSRGRGEIRTKSRSRSRERGHRSRSGERRHRSRSRCRERKRSRSRHRHTSRSREGRGHEHRKQRQRSRSQVKKRRRSSTERPRPHSRSRSLSVGDRWHLTSTAG